MAAEEEDERWLVVDGRRWRRQDPDLPDDARTALLSALGRGRSGVRTAKRLEDEEAVARSRRLVDLAKHGLGERGTPWWDQDADERRLRWQRALAALSALDDEDGPGRD